MREAILWGVEASPYALKLESCLWFKQVPFRRLPRDGGRIENLRTATSLHYAIRKRRVGRFPSMDSALDEYPSVPFFQPTPGEWLYDSSGVAQWLDAVPTGDTPKLYPEDPVQHFIAHLIDEAFDEFGLYMAHHNRWVISARDTRMGEETAKEFSRLVPWPFPRWMARHLPRRQVQRCPYLFSVAPQDYSERVESERIPPSRDGFPPTHNLLSQSWLTYLTAMESLLAQQPFLLGQRFTVADASAYGQLSMNLIDPSVVAIIKQRAPRTLRWLKYIRKGHHHQSRGELVLTEALTPLLNIIGQTFLPLMEQNEAAYTKAIEEGESVFNEAAFNQGGALYDGTLMGQPFRAVVKTFQVKVWRDLKAEWHKLRRGQDLSPASLTQLLAEVFPPTTPQARPAPSSADPQ